MATVQDINNKLESLSSEVKSIKDNYCEELAISKIEQMVYELKCAIIDDTLKVPELSVFSRHLGRLADRGNILYVSGLLHQCWRFVHPETLFDKPRKKLSPEEQVDIAFSKNTSLQTAAEQLDEKYYSLIYKHAKNMAGRTDRLFYQDYMRDLNGILSAICTKHSLYISPDFISQHCLLCELSNEKMDAVYTVLVEDGCVGEDDRSNFMASFSTTLAARTSQVRWRAINVKNNEINYAKLYVLFDVLNVEINMDSRAAIAEAFIAADGRALNPDSIKPRNSKSLDKFREKLEQVIAPPDSSGDL